MKSRLCVCRAVKWFAFSLYFSLLTGIFARDGFAGDCVLRQTVCSLENFSLILRKMRRFRVFSRVERARFGHWRSARRPNSPLFLKRLISSPFCRQQEV